MTAPSTDVEVTEKDWQDAADLWGNWILDETSDQG
jgi:hypothetical protein